MRAPSLSPLVLALAALGACSRRPSHAASASASAAASAPDQRSAPPPHLGSLGTPTAFELVAAPRGATLLWAPADRREGALRRVELDERGGFRGPATTALDAAAVPGALSDLAATWVNERLALAWVEREGAKARVRAAWAGTGTPPFELGPAWSGPRTARGNVVVAARGDHALVFARGDSAACIDPGQHGCFAFDFHELGASGVEHSGLPMSVPVPCSDDSAALAVVGRRLHYGVCTLAGERPVTTMFTIERDPDYARADPLLEGCMPTGTFTWQGAAWLLGNCEGGRRAVRLGAQGEAEELLDLHTLALECHAGTARIHAPSLDLPLDEPRSGLAGLLPSELAPPGARAVWTGRALVVATSLGDRVRLVRHTCAGDRLASDALDAR